MADDKLRVRGRPPADFDLPEGWDIQMLSMYMIGCSDAEVMVWIMSVRPSRKFSRDLWYKWIKDFSDFSDTVKLAHDLARAYFEKIGRENLTTGKMNYMGWLMQMRNRFGYKTEEKNTEDPDDAENKPKELGAPKINILPPTNEI